MSGKYHDCMYYSDLLEVINLNEQSGMSNPWTRSFGDPEPNLSEV